MIDILLAAYNGEAFLPALLDSLRQQTCKDFQILYRDDGSCDRTKEILYQAEKAFSQKVMPVFGKNPTPSPKGNFNTLLKASNEDYMMFCDQDDFWRKNKISLTLSAMKQAEKEFSKQMPILVHTDLAVTDQNLNVLIPSLHQKRRISYKGESLARLLVQNPVTGCTTMINRALKERMGEIPEEALMHDWWAALTAALFGKIIYIPTATLLYRQHSGNFVGASRLKNPLLIRKRLYASYLQAEALQKRFHSELSHAEQSVLTRYAEFLSDSKITKLRKILKEDYRKATPLETAGMILLG